MPATTWRPLPPRGLTTCSSQTSSVGIIQVEPASSAEAGATATLTDRPNTFGHHRQASTGRIITAAGSIMVFVFLAFILGGQLVMAEFGRPRQRCPAGALVTPAILVPAPPHLFGSRNWWLPAGCRAGCRTCRVNPQRDRRALNPWHNLLLPLEPRIQP